MLFTFTAIGVFMCIVCCSVTASHQDKKNPAVNASRPLSPPEHGNAKKKTNKNSKAQAEAKQHDAVVVCTV